MARVLSLLVAVAGLWRQWRSEPAAGPVTTPSPATSAGMISLDVPQSSVVDQIRGRDVLTKALLTTAGDTVADRRGWIRPPGTRSGTLLVTSRDSNHAAWGGWCHLHSVGMLADTEGARILTDLAGLAAGPPEQAERLSARLGGLPLALTLAGHYLADAGRLRLPGAISTYTDYQQALDRSGLTAVFPTPAAGSSALTGPQARAVVTRTWELSLPLLERRGLGPAVTLLRLLSLFAAAPVPLKVLDPDAIAASPAFPHADAILIRAWLDGLATLNLITLNTDAQESPATLHLHPLIRDASRHHLPAEQSSALYGLAAHLINLTTTGRANRPGNHTAWPLWQLISPHPAALLADITARRAPDPKAVGHAADAALRVTEYLAAISRYDTALTQARTILETCLAVLPAEHPTTLEAREDLAKWTGLAGDPEAARDQYAALLPIRERVLGPEHPETLLSRESLAGWTGDAGDPAAARDQYTALLPVYERVLGPEHSRIVDARSDLTFWEAEAARAGAVPSETVVSDMKRTR